MLIVLKYKIEENGMLGAGQHRFGCLLVMIPCNKKSKEKQILLQPVGGAAGPHSHNEARGGLDLSTCHGDRAVEGWL